MPCEKRRREELFHAGEDSAWVDPMNTLMSWPAVAGHPGAVFSFHSNKIVIARIKRAMTIF
jgi:hypothetical protein